MVILCHKCSGLLHADTREEGSELVHCGCISGYVRGFEPHLTREEAINSQIDSVRKRIDVFVHQGRTVEVLWLKERLHQLEKLVNERVEG